MQMKMQLLFLMLFIGAVRCHIYSEITEDLLREALEKRENSSITVTSYNIQPASKKGENTMSGLFRAYIQYSQNGSILNTTLIVKKQITEIRRKQQMYSQVFLTEMSVFSKALKDMNSVFPEKIRLSPKVFFFQVEEPRIIVMEDLASLGYDVIRTAHLDLEHSLLAMDVIARFHAASVCLYGNNLTAEYMFARTSDDFTNNFKNVTDEVSPSITEAPQLNEKNSSMSEVLTLQNNVTEGHREDEFNVLNHGDLHRFNVMFKHNSAHQPTDAILVDFQMCEVGSPVNDLVNFMTMGFLDDVLLDNTNILIKRYHSTLNASMLSIPCTKTAISLEKLNELYYASPLHV